MLRAFSLIFYGIFKLEFYRYLVFRFSEAI